MGCTILDFSNYCNICNGFLTVSDIFETWIYEPVQSPLVLCIISISVVCILNFQMTFNSNFIASKSTLLLLAIAVAAYFKQDYAMSILAKHLSQASQPSISAEHPSQASQPSISAILKNAQQCSTMFNNALKHSDMLMDA